MLYYIACASNDTSRMLGVLKLGSWTFESLENSILERVTYFITDVIEKDDLTGDEISIGNLVRIDDDGFRLMR